MYLHDVVHLCVGNCDLIVYGKHYSSNTIQLMNVIQGSSSSICYVLNSPRYEIEIKPTAHGKNRTISSLRSNPQYSERVVNDKRYVGTERQPRLILHSISLFNHQQQLRIQRYYYRSPPARTRLTTLIEVASLLFIQPSFSCSSRKKHGYKENEYDRHRSTIYTRATIILIAFKLLMLCILFDIRENFINNNY